MTVKLSKYNKYVDRPVDDTHTAAFGLDIGSEGCKDAHLLVCNCIVGFLTSLLRAPALSPPACWTKQEHITVTEY